MSLLIIATMSVCLSACGDDNEKDGPGLGKGPQDMIVGEWISTRDAYGDSWLMHLVFRKDKTGYMWWEDEPFADRDMFKYSIYGSEIVLKFYYEDDGEYEDDYETYTLDYEFSKKGDELTLYGFDDDDMEVLRFYKQ